MTGTCPMHILYIVYWGVLEPLGQSLVVPAILRFAGAGLHVTLVTFEKPADLADRKRFADLAEQFCSAGVVWKPLRYHQRPTVPATTWDIGHGCLRSVLSSLGERPDIIHGRTFVGGIIGSLLSRALRRPFVFHAEGFWPDERVAAGIWSPEGVQYKVAKRKEDALLRGAHGVIALSDRAREKVVLLRNGQPEDSCVVVPSCVDLERFQAAGQHDEALSHCRLVYLGSLGGRYRLDYMARFLKAIRSQMPASSLMIYSHSRPELARGEFQAHGIPDDWWSLDCVPHAQVPEALATARAGLHLLAPGCYVGSPTKIGEYWATGLPVVTTPDVGDIDGIIERERAGVIVRGDSDEAYQKAARELRSLLQDRELPLRCRRAAERYYSLDRGIETQLALYGRLTRREEKAV